MKKLDCTCLGIACLDISVYPFEIEYFKRDNVPVDGINSFAGGDAVNQALMLKILGLNVSLNTLIGKDDIGDILTAKLKHSDINLSSIRKQDNLKTSLSLIFVSKDGKRNIITQKGNNYNFEESHIDFKAIKKSKALSIGSIYGCIKLEPYGIKKALETAKKKHVLTFADLAEDKRGDKLNGLKPYIDLIDYFAPSYSQASNITDETDPERIVKKIKDIGAKNVILKLGEDGLLLDTEEFKGKIEGFKIDEIKDTTGAGDAFLACFIYKILKKNSIKKSAEFAACGAAISCKYQGANIAPLSESLINDYIKKGRG